MGLRVFRQDVPVLGKHVECSELQFSEYGKGWCVQWLRRAQQLDAEEKRVRSQRSGHVQTATVVGKQVLLIAEILKSI